jgi:hypothetical protein
MRYALASAAVMLLSACGVNQTAHRQRAVDVPTPPAPRTPPTPQMPQMPQTPPASPVSGCAPGSALIGTLVVGRAVVFVNGQPSGSGRSVCEGDDVRTNDTGTGDIIVSGGNDNDSIHLAENTDPRLRWTTSHCISIDGFTRGTINLTTNHHCMLLRTRDVLIYHPPESRAQYVVRPSSATEVKPYRGRVPVALQPISENDVHNLPVTQLLMHQAPPTVQPQQGSLNVYRGNVLAQPQRKLTPQELRLIEMMATRVPKVESPVRTPP